MTDPRLRQLFANPTFRGDLPGIVRLPLVILESIVRELSSADSAGGPYRASHVKTVARRAGVAEEIVGGAFALAHFATTLFEEGAATPADVHEEVVKVLGPSAAGVAEYRQHLETLASAKADLAAARHRRDVIAAGGRTLHTFSAVTEFRVRAASIEGEEDAELVSHQPEILELLPVITIKVSFASVDDGDDCVFQVTPAELDAVIKELQLAQRVASHASALVTLSRQSKSDGTV